MIPFNEISNKIIYNEFIEYLSQYVNINFVDKFFIWRDYFNDRNYFITDKIFIGTDNNNYYFLVDMWFSNENYINVYSNCKMNKTEFTAERSTLFNKKISINPFSKDNLFHLYYIKELDFNNLVRLLHKEIV